MARFVVLDSWRGIAACLVALFHLDAYSHLYGMPFLRNSWLFVDFFFVLSGFVIAANYQQRLLDGFGVGRFLLLRLGRLYPLHFAMLALFIAFELLKVLKRIVIPTLLSVNPIATEIYTYVVFAVCLMGLRRHAWIALLVSLIGGPVLIAALSEHNMNTHYDWGIIRCIYGFSAGVVSWKIYERWDEKLKKWFSGSIVECGVLGLVVVFVSVAGTTLLSIAAPYVFALVVLVFAFEAGAASAVLRLRPLVFLGTVSYSIYMTHAFIAKRIFDAGIQLDKRWHINPFTHRAIDGEDVPFLGTQLWHGDIAYPVYMAIIIAMSYFTYRWIEKPGREWVRNRVQRRRQTIASRGIVSA
ncbi:MAG: hypothetical protein DMD48_14790 [Gemmatimonadetes bacterium]|nr:MAG: hypothetical protein DMD48_14790 [Gemmatimonadota bacterium]